MATRDVYTDRFDEETTGDIPSTDCPECDGSLITDAGETRCQRCGLIVEAGRIDRRGPRVFEPEERSRKRTGAPLTNARHDRGLSTEIGRQQDGNGNPLSRDKRRQLGRLRREHSRAKWRTKAERNLSYGCTEIARVVSALNGDRSLREQASTLFRTAQDASLLRGRSIEAIATACVYAAGRCAGRTLTVDEVARVARVDGTRVRNAYSVLNRDLDLPVPPQRPAAFVPKIASAVEISPETRRSATDLAKQAADADLSTGVNPVGFAASCIAVAATSHDDVVRQYELADAADVSPATVRTHRDSLRTASEVRVA